MKKSQSTFIIVDDNPLLRDGLKSLLGLNTDYECIGDADNGRDAVEMVSTKQPDFVLMDLSMPKLNGFEAIRKIKDRFPQVKIMTLSIFESDEAVLKAMENGADGYCHKNASYQELQTALQTVLSGKRYISPQIKDKVMVGYLDRSKKLKSKTSWETLTQREREVLKLVAEGLKNSEIADLLSISIKTVEKHRANLMSKLDLNSKAKLTAYAIEKKLVEPGQVSDHA